MQIVPFGPEHVPAAAALAASRVGSLRRQVPVLPASYEDAATLAPLLEQITTARPAAAALQGDRLVGYLAAWYLPEFRGRAATYAPEWASGAEPEECARIYAALYAHMAKTWTQDGHRTHLFSLLPSDTAAAEAWRWLGLGMMAADAVRPLDAIGRGAGPALAFRCATPDDEETVCALAEGLDMHLAAPPVFLPLPVTFERATIVAQLGDPRFAHWLALLGNRPVGWLRIGPAHPTASILVRDAGTASITGAYVMPEARGQGVMRALLDRALAWAREGDYVRCAVDFEPMNPPAARFWTRWFTPVSFSMRRDG
jgi:GNAT superfamily N-acetyltransferase